MMQWNTLLKSLGFTDSEAKIYLLSLETGPSSVQDLAKKAKVSRVTTYAVIETLTERGLMSQVQKGKKMFYTAESPERLVSFVHTRVKQMESTLREVESLIGDLKLLQRGEKPVVKMFEGKEGLKAIHDDILQTNPDVILEMTNNDALYALFSGEDFASYRKELDKRNIRHEGIVLSSQPLKAVPRVKASQISEKEFSFFGNITIYAHKVALTSLQGKNISVLVESEIIAQSMKEMFRLAMRGAEKK
jgi:HTH-type transcriptional regulator, sugar sensing transcriptional regulator